MLTTADLSLTTRAYATGLQQMTINGSFTNPSPSINQMNMHCIVSI